MRPIALIFAVVVTRAAVFAPATVERLLDDGEAKAVTTTVSHASSVRT